MTPRGVQLTSKHVQQPAVYSISSQSESGPLLPQFSGDIKPGKFEIVTSYLIVQRAKE